jgi:hypothetical protein
MRSIMSKRPAGIAALVLALAAVWVLGAAPISLPW